MQFETDDILIVIPARGGSKGIPNKNIKLLAGKPLIHYSIEIAQQIVPNNQIIVSTDSEAIKKISEQKGVKIENLRPENLASDIATTYDVLLHEINSVEKTGWKPKVLILLQPTSPFRKLDHVKGGIEKFKEGRIDLLVGVNKTSSNPYYTLYEENESGFLEQSKKSNFKRRQDCPTVWEINGALYIVNIEVLKQQSLSEIERRKGYEMDEYSSIDLDTPLDWIIAESVIEHNQK
jgi:N-acylneuraminate cytidylyltransferase